MKKFPDFKGERFRSSTEILLPFLGLLSFTHFLLPELVLLLIGFRPFAERDAGCLLFAFAVIRHLHLIADLLAFI